MRAGSTVEHGDNDPGDHQRDPESYGDVSPGSPRLLRGAALRQASEPQLAVVERGADPNEDESHDDKKASSNSAALFVRRCGVTPL